MSLESGFLIVKVSNKKNGIPETSLFDLFYGNGNPDNEENPNHRLMHWFVEDDEEKMDRFEFTLSNPDMVLWDSPLLKKGNTVKIQYGYPDRMSGVYEGVITGRRGWRVLTISGEFKNEIVLANNKSTEKFVNKTYSQIARELFEREGLKAVVDDSRIVHPVTIKKDETTLQFLTRLGNASSTKDKGGHFLVYVENDVGFFVTSQLKKAPALTIKWGGTEQNDDDYITVGEPEYNDEQKNTRKKDTVKGFDMLEKKAFESNTDNEKSKQTSLDKNTYYFDEAAGTRKLKPAGSLRSAETGDAQPTHKQKGPEADAIADSSFDKRNKKAFQLRWSILGDPSVKAKTVVFIDIEAKELRGRWYLHSVRHGGTAGAYLTELFMSRNATGGTEGLEEATPEGSKNTEKPQDKKKVTYVFDEKKGTRVPKK